MAKGSCSNEGSVTSSSNKSLIKDATATKLEVNGDGGSVHKAASNSSFIRNCYKCHGYGHIASDCLNRMTVTIIENVIEKVVEDPSNEDKSVEEVTEFAYEDEVLVIWRSLNVLQENEES